ncbi:MAG: hypothetical protein COW88_01535 [Candidatus Lloydbacteria bacterium CG22_combo_CG10-13_8_21_14_all_47_15]|uniref:Uncharacterized protein n=1 Tax=Candidatus Lloydbacteria bacterium CG22_combo_CG10-13_8_21_14_all_47_15 TaxID=1974635 RepID=A0A2H0CUF7_9BACT|nr:MAG: hypothetical protein COW88_01535 [Candidatus Lloydbacteria bacterium CG22_combo_CG10-13_8_21_14_all_47_15]
MNSLLKVHAAVVDKRIIHDPGCTVMSGCRRKINLDTGLIITVYDIGENMFCYDCLKVHGKHLDPHDEVIYILMV